MIQTCSSAVRNTMLIVGTFSMGLGGAAANPPNLDSTIKFAPEVGSSFIYNVESNGQFKFDAARMRQVMSSATSMRSIQQSKFTFGQEFKQESFTVSGQLHIRVVAQAENSRWLSVRFQNYASKMGAQVETRTSVFETPFLMKVKQNGVFEEFQFPWLMPKEIAATLQGVVEGMQVVLPSTLKEAESGNWEHNESKSSGHDFVAYTFKEQNKHMKSVTFTRQLLSTNRIDALANLAAASSGKKVEQPNSLINQSQGRVVWALDGSGPLEVSTIEDVSNSIASVQASQISMNIKFTRVTTSAGEAIPATALLPDTLAAAQTQLKDLTHAKAMFYEVDAGEAKELAGVDRDAMVIRFHKLYDQNKASAMVSLKYFLRMHPQESLPIAQEFNKLEGSEVNSDKVALVYAAFGAAGHVEAQTAMQEVISGPQYSNMSRQLALRGTSSLKLPELSLIRTVWDFREALPRSGHGWKIMLSIATNIYGALGGYEHLDEKNTYEVAQVLGHRLNSTDSHTEKLFMLSALGNVGEFNLILPYTQAYMISGNDHLRRRSFHTFQKQPSEESFAMFEQRYAAETLTDVRRTAASVADSMPATPYRNRWAAEQVMTESDTQIQAKLVRILGDNVKQFAKNQQVLFELLDAVDDREVRKTIYRYIDYKGQLNGKRGAK